MAGGALTLSVGLSVCLQVPPFSPQRRSHPRGLPAALPPKLPKFLGRGPGGPRGWQSVGPSGSRGLGGGGGARWRGRGAGRPGKPEGPAARQRSWVGVSRWPWESAGRASNCARSGWHGLVPRRRAAASPPLVQRGGRGHPPTRAHTASSRTSTSPRGWGSPEDKEEGGSPAGTGWGEERRESPCTHNHRSVGL